MSMKRWKAGWRDVSKTRKLGSGESKCVFTYEKPEEKNKTKLEECGFLRTVEHASGLKGQRPKSQQKEETDGARSQ